MQAMLQRTLAWLADLKKRCLEEATAQGMVALTIDEVQPPPLTQSEPHGRTQNLTPAVISAWLDAPPPLAKRFPRHEHFIMALHTELVWSVAPADTIVDAMPELLQEVQCRNYKDAEALAEGKVPDRTLEESDDEADFSNSPPPPAADLENADAVDAKKRKIKRVHFAPPHQQLKHVIVTMCKRAWPVRPTATMMPVTAVSRMPIPLPPAGGGPAATQQVRSNALCY